MGLVQVMATIINHHGAISINNSDGCTVHLWLPLHKEKAKPPKEHYDVLVIDDDPWVLETVIELIETLSLRVIGACKLDVARKIFGENSIGTVLLDVRIGTMNGIAFAEEILQISSDQRIVLMSGQTHTHQIAQLEQQHHVQFIQKPIRLATIKQLFRPTQRPDE